MKRKIITGITLAAVVALLALFAAPSYRQGEPSPAGGAAKQFTFEMNGKPARLSDLRGKVVVLNFWATWCPPCVEETPSLVRLQQEIAPLGGTVLGISVDDDQSAYRSFLQNYEINYPNYRDPSKKISTEYGTYMYPETYIIDRQGRIARKLIGPQNWQSPALQAYLNSLLNARS